ncbi:basic helix-loop-helix (bHLH) DNA-binding superfamily protein [Raphanus sativus]|uniref:Transcription factor bHLH167-like n=1 Tax=Raphanus sativus TaxID=3726 RepID=A0A9W3C9W9_RAPSA|nr:transcription factor bHLH167-like [Raphanus sativus]KAJ4879133.1 basic helix-loop-helix (bHLH) DNA-binding superfamily protein [Raphanus sativus]
MERETGREVGEGSSMSSREQRNLREQERRMRMKHLYNILSSLVSPTHRLSVPQLIEQATSYMIQLKEKVNYLREKKMTLLEEMGKHSEGSSSSLLPKLSIYSRDSTIQMNLIMDLNMKRVTLHQLIRVFEEEGAQVMNANIQKLNDRMVIYTIIAQAIIARIGIDPSSIEERVRNIIF